MGPTGEIAVDQAAAAPSPTQELVQSLADRSKRRFSALRQILSYQEYLEAALRDPALHTRDAARYLRDVFDFYGSYEVPGYAGPMRRFRLFDAPFEGRGVMPVLGQEPMQNEVYKHLTAFCDKGRVDKLLMIHGPNGTAKSTFVECVMAGLEDYSARPEGVLYTFNWIFSDAAERNALGFHEKSEARSDGSLAYLEPEEITFKLGSELKDHPLLLIPREEREELLREAFTRAGQPFRLPDALLRGDLAAKNREIYRALSNAYQGDWNRIIQHVQVERIYVSQRYRSCAVSIQPQRNVDAMSRPLNLEKSYRLPPILNQSTLSEVSGDLVDANRGVVEYSDFFKRPLDLSKYLLTTSEKGVISLPDTTAYLDCVFFATCNEKNLTLFKRNPDFPSFKGRFELVRAPYLLKWSEEEKIYARRITSVSQKKHVAPHTTRIVALWAVLTRLRRPQGKHYKGEVGSLIARLRPLDKANLYDSARAPDDWPDADRRLLRANLERLSTEYDNAEEEFEGLIDAAYEGRRGASPREILTILGEAAQDEQHPCLSPLAVLREIRRVIADKSLYEFLRLEPDSGYGDIDRLTDDVQAEYRRLVKDEIQRAVALVEESAYEALFEDYFRHVKSFDSGEKLRNRITGALEPASDELMTRVEAMVGVTEKPATFRKNLIVRIAAWALDHPGQRINYREIFHDMLQAVKASYHRERDAAVRQVHSQLLRYGTEDWVTVAPSDQVRIEAAMTRFRGFGYCDRCAKEALHFVLRRWDEE